MNKYIVSLKCDLTLSMRRYFKKRGVDIAYESDFLRDVFVCHTILSKEEINNMMYVFEAKDVGVGRFLSA